MRTLLAIAVLTVVGPLFAILPVSLYVAAAAKLTALSQVRLTDFLDLLLFGLLLGYLLAWPYALITGVIVAAWSLWRQPAFLVAIAAALVADAILYFVGPVPAIFMRHEPYPLALQLQESIFFSLIVVSVCWLIFRRMARR